MPMTPEPNRDPASQQPPASAPHPSAPPAGWAPTPLSGVTRPAVPRPAAGGGPSAPLGGSNLPSTRIDEFAAPRSWWPLVVGVVAVLAAALIWASTTLRPALPSATKPSPTPAPTATAPGRPFVSPNERYSGRWEILQSEWTDSGVEVQIRISVDKGPLSYSFVAFENNSVTASDTPPAAHSPCFSGYPIETGDTETGWLLFPLERGQATVILANAAGSQMSALPIPG